MGKRTKRIFRYVIGGLVILAIIGTILPLLALDYWFIRLFDFPQIQFAIVTFALVVAYALSYDVRRWAWGTVGVVLIGCFALQIWRVYTYIPLLNEEVKEVTDISSPSVRLMTYNVFQDNENYGKAAAIINNAQPEVLLLTEVNKTWLSKLSSTLQTFPYKVEVPLDNTYGMALYSKKPLLDTAVRYLVDDSIPSIEAKISVGSNKVQLFAIHPTPPMPQENPMSTDRDAEIMQTARQARLSILPVIVMGDFNDVAWSHTSRLFQRTSGLLDPRIGRGLYSTYHAQYPLFRWPLDHFFVDEEFTIGRIDKLEAGGSDHFPIAITLHYEPNNGNVQWYPYDQEDLEDEQEIIDRLENDMIDF